MKGIFKDMNIMKHCLSMVVATCVGIACAVELTSEWGDIQPGTTLYQLGDSLYAGTNFTKAVNNVVD